jgi:predicted nucleic acid-binding protein
VAALVDTNVLVYRHDPRYPEKKQIATDLLKRGVAQDSLRIPHQAIVEFVSAVSRPSIGGRPMLTREEAHREAEDLLSTFEILYPTEALVRMALRAAIAYRLEWFDAHLWAYADYYGLDRLISEDFEHGRLYGTVRAVNPFLPAPR